MIHGVGLGIYYLLFLVFGMKIETNISCALPKDVSQRNEEDLLPDVPTIYNDCSRQQELPVGKETRTQIKVLNLEQWMGSRGRKRNSKSQPNSCNICKIDNLLQTIKYSKHTNIHSHSKNFGQRLNAELWSRVQTKAVAKFGKAPKVQNSRFVVSEVAKVRHRRKA